MLRRRPQPVVSRYVAAAFALLIAIPAALLVVPIWPADDSLAVGDRAPRDLVARRDAQYESQVLTERAREEAAESVSPALLPIDPNIRTRQAELLEDAFAEIRTVRQRSDLATQQAKLAALDNSSAVEAMGQSTLATLVGLADARLEAVQTAAEAGLDALLSRPIQEATNVGELVDEYVDTLPASSPVQEDEEQLLADILSSFVAVNTEVDEARTEELRENARANVAPEIVTYTSGQTVVTEGSTLAEEDVEALRETGVINDSIDLYDLGAGILGAFGLGGLLGVYVYQLQPVPAPALRRLMLIAVAVVATLAAVRVVAPALLPDTEQQYLQFMIPVAAAAMIATSFADLQFGALVAVAVGLFAAFIAATDSQVPGANFSSAVGSLEIGLAYAGGGLAGASAVFRAERLGRYVWASFAVALATALVLGVFWLIEEPRTPESLAWLGGASAIAGVGAGIVTVGVFVLLSMVFGVTTRLQLMELAQSNSPLLRRLQDEAPGTYHHSMMVGALAERAAEQIGADALVTRAGAYYHDIGKLAQPHFYVENMLDGRPSPHESIPPEQSARRIIEHVTNGVEIARKNRIPDVVRDFIPQHHGTRLVTYFYRKAVNAGDNPDPADFAYSGPRPRSKEAAIVMLADSCEAVVRAGENRSPEHISNSVDAIFAERLAEGQLDECDITMRELQVVATSFKATLRAVYHQRIEYPAATEGEAAVSASSPGP
ncbi:MAG: HDIG domain-containing protein [Dehalococcoidia bacterium]|nr:HDIG domain-containing protein [Dehalococcoidia bacterium]